MSEDIAVIGNEDSIEYFRILGCMTYETHEGELTAEQYREILDRRFKIVLVTEEVFQRYRDLIRRRSERMFPVISIIPDVHGAFWDNGEPRAKHTGFEELRQAVIKAVGQDISGSGG